MIGHGQLVELHFAPFSVYVCIYHLDGWTVNVRLYMPCVWEV